jgi:hypothetical protein
MQVIMLLGDIYRRVWPNHCTKQKTTTGKNVQVFDFICRETEEGSPDLMIINDFFFDLQFELVFIYFHSKKVKVTGLLQFQSFF